jgi:hypothetical protein
VNGQQRAAAAALAVVLLVGVVLIGVGCWMWFPPAGLIAPGALLVAVAAKGLFGVDVGKSGDA